jgi:hypothetical protein
MLVLKNFNMKEKFFQLNLKRHIITIYKKKKQKKSYLKNLIFKKRLLRLRKFFKKLSKKIKLPIQNKLLYSVELKKINKIVWEQKFIEKLFKIKQKRINLKLNKNKKK